MVWMISPRIGNARREPAVAKIHHMVQVDGDILHLCYLQNPVGAVISAICRVSTGRLSLSLPVV